MLAVDEVLGLLLERENQVVLEDRPVCKLRCELEGVAGEARQVDSRWATLNLAVKRRGELADGRGEVLLVAADVLLRDRNADVGGGERDEVGSRRCRLGTRGRGAVGRRLRSLRRRPDRVDPQVLPDLDLVAHGELDPACWVAERDAVRVELVGRLIVGARARCDYGNGCGENNGENGAKRRQRVDPIVLRDKADDPQLSDVRSWTSS